MNMTHEDNNNVINTNSLAFIALAKEYCVALQGAAETERDVFLNSMVKLLPRLYITATDLKVDMLDYEEGYLEQALDEDYYEQIRRSVETVMGPDDVFLEVFEEDMKYSDTPVSASISEGLADLFQVMFNFLATIKDATDENTAMAINQVKEDFKTYWSQTLCNTLRPINSLVNN